jgi:hypothetical protein
MSVIDDLAEELKKRKNGEKLALMLLEYLSDENLSSLLTATLSSLKYEVLRYEDVRLTPAEREAYKLVQQKGVVTYEDLKQLSDKFASFKHRSHTSAIMNSLVDKGLVGKIKLGKDLAYATPKEAVIWALKMLDQLPRECNPKVVSDLTALPLIRVVEVLKELGR